LGACDVADLCDRGVVLAPAHLSGEVLYTTTAEVARGGQRLLDPFGERRIGGVIAIEVKVSLVTVSVAEPWMPPNVQQTEVLPLQYP
jgi:hypothetical protein